MPRKHILPISQIQKITMKTNYHTIIAIDPDVTKSGVAFLEVENRLLELSSLTFPQLTDYLKFVRKKSVYSETTTFMEGMEKPVTTIQKAGKFIVVVEAGWLNAVSNYHTAAGRRGQRIAKNVGANHQAGKMIVEMCRHYEIPVTTIKPLKKMWKGKDGKITQEEIASFTGITGRNNQEERDAALLAWVYAGLPIKINFRK